MPRHQRAKAEVVIDVLIPIDVVNLAALSIPHKNRIRLVVPIVAGDTKWNASQVRVCAPPPISACAFRRVAISLSSASYILNSITCRSVPCGQFVLPSRADKTKLALSDMKAQLL